MAFLSEHYSETAPNDGDHEKDKQLPFKSHEECLSQNVWLCEPDAFFAFSLKSFSSPIKTFTLYKTNSFKPSFLSSIWQPPKFS